MFYLTDHMIAFISQYSQSYVILGRSVTVSSVASSTLSVDTRNSPSNPPSYNQSPAQVSITYLKILLLFSFCFLLYSRPTQSWCDTLPCRIRKILATQSLLHLSPVANTRYEVDGYCNFLYKLNVLTALKITFFIKH